MKHFVCVLAIGLLFTVVTPLSAYGQEDRKPPGTDLEVAVVFLKTTNAEDVASVVKQAFNGSGPGRVGVFAIPFTNCIFVKATRIDLLTIRQLLGSM
jgi:hypothetical protein